MPHFLGQHFLKDDATIKKIVAAIDVQPGETIIEIGPGHGELTLPLAQAASKTKALMIAIEKDTKLIEPLRARLKNLKLAHVEVVTGDVLSFLKTTPPDRAPYKLAGNLPYYLTGHLLRTISKLSIPPVSAVFMVQKEVALRMIAEPPRMNRLAASVQYFADVKLIASVPRQNFSPPPKVDSAVVALRTKVARVREKSPQTAQALYYFAVRTLFAQPRKTILNNLAATISNKAAILDTLRELSLDPAVRPQDLTIENILQIAKSDLLRTVYK
jgi:16S rRNA (adenine1518-N6/adenine1519-N6)-dimethyltransferase